MNNLSIYSNKLNNTEFTRSLSRRNIFSFNTVIYNATSLCDEINAKLGMPVIDTFLSVSQTQLECSTGIIDTGGIKHFKDIANVVNTINELGKYLDYNDPSNDFKEKVITKLPFDNNIKALDEWLNNFLDSFNKRHIINENLYLYRILNIIEEPLFDEINILDNEVFTPLEKELLKKAFKNINVISIFDLFHTKKTNRNISNIIGGYGEQNEIEKIISEIYTNKYPIDKVSILLANPSTYSFYLYQLSKQYQIPMTFQCGVPITLSNPYKVYKYIYHIMTLETNVWEYYLALFDETFFDCKSFFETEDYVPIKQLFSLLSFSFTDFEKNDEIYSDLCKNGAFRDFFFKQIDRKIDVNVALGTIKNCLLKIKMKPSLFVEKYYVRRTNDLDNKLDISALTEIKARLDNSELLDGFTKTSYLRDTENALIMKNSSKEGALFIGDLNSGFSTLRDVTYITGLSANNFPHKQNENYLMSNRAYSCLVPEDKRHNETKQLEQQKDLDTLIELLSSLNSKITLSYSYQNLDQVKENNPSSIIFDLAPTVKNFNIDDLRKYGSYFDSDISKFKKLAYAKKTMTPIKLKPSDVKQKPDLTDYLNKVYSPSSLHTFIECPLQFYLNQIEGFQDDDVSKDLGPLQFGNIIHFIAKQQADTRRDDAEFKEYTDDFFNFIFGTCFKLEEYGFGLMDLTNAAENIRGILEEYTPKYSEYVLPITNLNGIKFSGCVDLIAIKNNKYYIIDYKTNQQIRHLNEDFDTCIQTIIYAFMVKQNLGIDIEACIYYYARNDERVYYSHPLASKDKLDELLNNFKQTLQDKSFTLNLPSSKSNKTCKYCKYQGVCPNHAK